MVSTFPPLKYSAKIHLRNLSAHAFGQNTPLRPKNSAWCKMSFIITNLLSLLFRSYRLLQSINTRSKIHSTLSLKLWLSKKIVIK